MSRYVKDANGVWHPVAGLEAIDSTPTQGSTAAVSSGGVYASEQTIKQALTTKFDKSGGNISGSVNVVTSTNSASVMVQDTNGNKAYIMANSEGGNIGGAKPNNATRFELDGQPMNGSTGYARLMLGDATKINQKTFKFNEDGSFTDGNGLNLSNMLGGCYMRVIDNMSDKTLNIVASGGEQTFLVFLNQLDADNAWVLYRIETTSDGSAIRKDKMIEGSSTYTFTITYAPATYTISIKPSANWFNGMILSTYSFTTSLS